MAFADAADGISRPLLLLKGVWLALASGYKSATGLRADRRARDPRRHGEHAEHHLADDHRARLRRVVEKAGVIDRLITPIIQRGEVRGPLIASLRRARYLRPISSRPTSICASCCPADVQARLRQSRICADGRCRAHGASEHLPTADPLEQLRRVYGCDPGCCHVELPALRGLQPCEPVAGDRLAYTGLRMMRATATPAQASAPKVPPTGTMG